MAGASEPPNMQCTQLKSGILLGEGKEGRKERETENAEREEEKEQRVGRAPPFKGTGYCLPCMWGDCQVPQGQGQVCLDTDSEQMTTLSSTESLRQRQHSLWLDGGTDEMLLLILWGSPRRSKD